jgi:N-acetylmuramoyl-L-alanine amidase
MSKVFIKAGHAPNGLPDPGAIGPAGLRECDVALAVREYLESYLHGAGIETRLMQDDSLSAVCGASNNYRPDCFVSVHCNGFASPAAKGMEIYTSPGQTAADPLADAIMRQLEGDFPALNVRGDWQDGDVDIEAGLYVLLHTNAPAVLVELAFITNEQEEALLRMPEAQRRYAAAIARGIADWLRARGEGMIALLLQKIYQGVLSVVAKGAAQKILDSTDIDEKVLADVGKLSDKAKAALVKYDNRQVYKALAVGAAVGIAVGLAIGKAAW